MTVDDRRGAHARYDDASSHLNNAANVSEFQTLSRMSYVTFHRGMTVQVLSWVRLTWMRKISPRKLLIHALEIDERNMQQPSGYDALPNAGEEDSRNSNLLPRWELQ